MEAKASLGIANNTMKNKLIFDLGFLNGEDSLYYISKGFNVVALEANPILCKIARRRLKKQIKSKQLTLCNNAISKNSVGMIDFYINKKRPEVSSTEKWIADQNGEYKVEKITIPTVGLFDLITTYGVPDYLKVDIEGMDKEISKQLVSIPTKSRPQYISFELNKIDYFDIFMNLKICNYTKFQLVNQIHNKPNCSGDFGGFLPKQKWIGFDEALSRYMKYRELKIIDNVNLGVGWMDLHAEL